MSVPVTILMPAYNAGQYIREATASVLAQTFTDFELLIVNDGSQDDTAEVVASFDDPRIRWIDCAHGGVAAALNRGLSMSRGRYIARFDADDICMPGRIETQYDFMESHPDHVLAGSDALYMLESGEELFHFRCIGHTHEEISSVLYRYCPFIHSAVMYRKDAVLQAGGYHNHAHNFEDYLLWTRLANAGKLCNLDEPLIRVRFNPSSVTMDEKWRGRRFRAIKRNCILRGDVSEAEGAALTAILERQDVRSLREAAYYALCAKKFLAERNEPARAREFLHRAIQRRPLRLDNYALFAASFFPAPVIQWLHQKSPNRL